jgi:hypothetical protein
MQFPRRLLPTDTWVRLAIVPVLVVLALSANHQYLFDFWHHLARGREIVRQGQLLDHDIFTYTVADEPFRDANWLSQVTYYLLYQQGGLELVRLVNSLTMALTLFLVVLLAWRRSGSAGLAAAVGVFTFVGSWQVLTLRPQTFSLLLFVIVYWALDRARQRPWWLVVPPLLIGLWTNLHGAFPAGIMLVGCYLLAAAWDAWRAGNLWRDRHFRLMALCLVGSVLATLVNPYGWGIYEYVGITSARAAARNLIEWQPPDFDRLLGWAWAASMALAVGLHVVAWRRGHRPQARDVVLLLCFGFLACRSMRMLVWWQIVLAPVVAELLAVLRTRPAEQTRAPRPAAGPTMAFAVLVLAVVFCLPGLDQYHPLLRLSGCSSEQTEQDLDAVHEQLLAQGSSGRVFARFEWGEYLSWAASPRFRIFMDGRIEIYPDDVWQQYIDLTSGKDDWQQILDHYQVDYLVLDAPYHRENGLLERVEHSGRWQKVFQVRDEIYLYRRGGSSELNHRFAKR